MVDAKMVMLPFNSYKTKAALDYDILLAKVLLLAKYPALIYKDGSIAIFHRTVPLRYFVALAADPDVLMVY
jgi:hypothetical protein